MKKTLLALTVVVSLIATLQAQNVGIGTNDPKSKLDIEGALALREGTAINLSNGSNDNVSIADGYSFYRITGPTAAFSIKGIAGGSDGKLITLVNTTAQVMTIENNASGTAANSIKTLTGSDMASVAGGSSVTLQYNQTEQRWYVTATQNFEVAAGSIAKSDIKPGTNSAITVTNGAGKAVGAGDVVLDVKDNALNQKGVVPGPTSLNGSQAWVTDPSGNPAWAKIPNVNLENNGVTVNTGTGLSGGGTVALGGNITLTNAGDLSSTNEAQTLSGDGTSNIKLSDVSGTGGGSVTLQGGGATSVSRSGNTFTISSTDNNSGGTVTSVGAGTGLTGGPITGSGTISLANVGTAGTYTKVTTNAQGQVTSGATLSAGDIPDLGSSYIKNQSFSAQNATFWINGDGRYEIDKGPYWAANTDAGFVRFHSTGDAAGQSWLEIGTNDNGDEPITFTQSGSERMRVHTNGFVGIGNNDPTAMLDVKGNGNTSAAYGLGVRNSDNVYSLVVRNDGNVGIGTTSPTARFEINLATSNGWGGNLKAMRILSPDNGYYMDLNTYIVSGGNVGYHFSPNGNTGMAITTPGNVGIGTTTPGFKLDVNGSLNISATNALTYGTTPNTRSFTANGAGDLTIPLGKYNAGTVLTIQVNTNGGWAEYGAKYIIARGWGNGSPVILQTFDGSIGSRIKFYHYGANGYFYLFATWENQSPGKAYSNTVDIVVSATNGWAADYGSFASASLISSSTGVSIKSDGAVWGMVPIGTVLPWWKNGSGTPSLPSGWVECNGATVWDAESPYNGVAVPDMNNTNRFPRGNTSSGGTGGSATHTHTISVTQYPGWDLAPDASHYSDGTLITAAPASNLPPYMDFVYIIRVK